MGGQMDPRIFLFARTEGERLTVLKNYFTFMPEKALLNLSPEPQHKFDLFPEENKPEDLRAEYKINPDCHGAVAMSGGRF